MLKNLWVILAKLPSAKRLEKLYDCKRFTLYKKVALTARAIEKMKPETFLADIGENEGLRVNKGKTGLTSFFYRFRSPIDNSLKKVKIGTYPDMSLAEARVELQNMKIKRRAGICPSQELKDQKEQKKIEQVKIYETNTRSLS